MRKTLHPGRQPVRQPPEFDPLDDGPLMGVTITEIRAGDPVSAEVAPTYPDEEVVRQRGAWILMAALALAAVVAIGAVVTLGGDSSSPTAPADDVPGQASTAPAVVKTDEQKIVDTYLGYRKAESDAQDVADPNFPGIADFTTGTQLQVVRDALQRVRDNGWVTRSPANSVAEQRVTVESIAGDHARFRACELDDGFVVQAATGQPLAESRVSTSLWTGEMVREGGRWKVSTANRQQKWEGVTGCWVGE